MHSYSAPFCSCSLRQNLLDAEAAKFLAEGLKANTGLTALEYAAYRTSSAVSTHCEPFTPSAPTDACCACVHSVGDNGLTEEAALSIVRMEKQRNKLTTLGLAGCKIGPAGAKEIADWVSASTTISSLE